eukprot:1006353-Prorocentrum_minimum.AAC.1
MDQSGAGIAGNSQPCAFSTPVGSSERRAKLNICPKKNNRREAARKQATARGPPSEGVKGGGGGSFGRAKTPKGPQHRLQTANQGVRYIKGVRRFAERSPVTNNGDAHDSQKLGSACFKRGL